MIYVLSIFHSRGFSMFRLFAEGISGFLTRLITLGLAIFLSSCGYAQDVERRWREDIDFYAKHLVANHIDPFHSVSKTAFNDEILSIKESLSEISENQIIVKLMRLTRKVNDGHTSFPLWGQQQVKFPLELKIFDKEIRVVGTTAQHKEILGSKLVSINGKPASEIIRLLSELSPFSENPYSTAVRVAGYLPYVTVLNGLGVIDATGEGEFVFSNNGLQRAIHLQSGESLKLDSKISHLNDILFQPVKSVDDNLWFGSSADKKTIYVKFRRYTSVSKMEGFARNLLKFINQNRSENLIIDLRDNYGGDFFVGLKLAQLLVLADTINWKTGVYTLIDNVTFSAAMSNAAQFSQILNSKLVGSPSGATPSGYQDMGQFTLPNSRFEVTYSKRLYHFKENQKDALYPDVQVDVSIDDYKNGYDRQLRWVLGDIRDEKGSEN